MYPDVRHVFKRTLKLSYGTDAFKDRLAMLEARPEVTKAIRTLYLHHTALKVSQDEAFGRFEASVQLHSFEIMLWGSRPSILGLHRLDFAKLVEFKLVVIDSIRDEAYDEWGDMLSCIHEDPDAHKGDLHWAEMHKDRFTLPNLRSLELRLPKSKEISYPLNCFLQASGWHLENLVLLGPHAPALRQEHLGKTAKVTSLTTTYVMAGNLVIQFPLLRKAFPALRKLYLICPTGSHFVYNRFGEAIRDPNCLPNLTHLVMETSAKDQKLNKEDIAIMLEAAAERMIDVSFVDKILVPAIH